jgi:hypothetical protein
MNDAEPNEATGPGRPAQSQSGKSGCPLRQVSHERRGYGKEQPGVNVQRFAGAQGGL